MTVRPDRITRERVRAARPFLAVAAAAIVAAGIVAAAIAHAPSQTLVWMVAYLVLVVGVAQALLGAGQAVLATPLPAPRARIVECVVFNAGNIGVIAGTLLSCVPLVLAGTLLFIVSLAMFVHATREARNGWQIHAYRGVLLLVTLGAVTGLVLSIVHAA